MVGWICADGDLEQRGLAGAVGAEDHPALVLLDRPVDPVEQGGLAPPDGHAGELEDGVHVLCGLPRARRSWTPDLGGAAGATAGPRRAAAAYARRVSSSALPLSARFALWFSAWVAGRASLDDTRDAIVGDDAAHDVVGLPGADDRRR